MLLAAAARRRGIGVKVLDAVSSFDSLLNLLAGAGPLQEMRLTMLRTQPGAGSAGFTPDTDTFFFAVGHLGGIAGTAARGRFARAAAKAYPSGAPALLAACSSISGERSVSAGDIKELDVLLEKAGPEHTLFIPAARGSARWKKAFRSLV